MSRPSRQPSPLRAGLWVGALVIALAIMATTFGRPPSVTYSSATSFLPPDGYRVRFTGPTGAMATEWAVDQASQLINPGPVHFRFWLGKAKLSFTDTLAARQTTVFTNSAGAVVNREDIFSVISPEGVATGVEARSWTDSRFYYPARLDLPNTVAAGKSWVSQGDAQLLTKDGKFPKTTYRAYYQASAPTSHDELVRRCLHVTMTLRVGEVTEPPVTRTWCPRLGVITLAETDGTWQAAVTNTSVPAPTTPHFDWSRVNQLTFSPHTINNALVPGSLLASPLSAPAVLSDGTIVAVQKQFNDSVGLSTQSEPISSVWRVRPGGSAVSTATFGDLTVVATTNRQLIAYDRFGRWVWQAPLPDQAEVAPVQLGNRVVVATLDGSVTAVELTNGNLAWTARVGDAVRLLPRALGDRLVIADVGGTLTCFDAEGTQLWARDSLSPRNLTLAAGTTPVAVIGDGRRVIGLSVADGSQQWEVPLRMSLTTLIPLDDVVVIRDGNLTVGIDPTSGATQWTWDRARTYAAVGEGRHVLLLTASGLVALDAGGAEIKQWPLALAGPDLDQPTVSLGTDRVLIWAHRTVLLGVAE